MARLGSHKRPAVAQARTMERAEEIVSLCDSHGWKVVVGIEPNKPEDTADIEALLTSDATPSNPGVRVASVGRNDPCICGSGRKFKKCCGQ